MDGSVWDCCPADINAVERKNQDSEDIAPQQLQSAMINLKANTCVQGILQPRMEFQLHELRRT